MLTATGCSPDPMGSGGTDSEGSDGPAATESGTADGSSGEAACGTEDDQLLLARDGTLVEPMILGFAEILGIDVARSGTPEMGTVTMTFTTTCEGPLHLWALVWDAMGGVAPENADSIYVRVDDGEERAWIYGCETDGPNERWHWLTVQAWSMAGTQCDHEPFVIESLPAGEHTIVIRGREGGVGGVDVAAIAGVVVSHVAETDPNPFFEIPEPEM